MGHLMNKNTDTCTHTCTRYYSNKRTRHSRNINESVSNPMRSVDATVKVSYYIHFHHPLSLHAWSPDPFLLDIEGVGVQDNIHNTSIAMRDCLYVHMPIGIASSPDQRRGLGTRLKT